MTEVFQCFLKKNYVNYYYYICNRNGNEKIISKV